MSFKKLKSETTTTTIIIIKKTGKNKRIKIKHIKQQQKQ